MQTTMKQGLSVKDLVTVGIFTALFLVFALVGGIFFAPNPVLTFYMPVGSALLCGPVYLLLLAKVPKRWAVTILGAILCLVWFVTGMHWAMALGYLIAGILADLTAGTGATGAGRATPSPTSCCPWAARGLISCSSRTRRAGPAPCWATARSRATSTPCG